MKRALVLVCCVLLGIGLAASGQVPGVAVPPNGAPAPPLVPASVCYPGCVSPTDIVAADFTGDGWLDLAVSCSTTGNVFYYISYGFPRGVLNVPFAVPVVAPNPFPSATFLLAGTFTPYDGIPDLAVVHSPAVGEDLASLTVVPKPIGAGAFVAPGVALAGVGNPLPGAPVIHIASGNLNNDNVTDLVYLTAAGCTALVSTAGAVYTAVVPVWPDGGGTPEVPVAAVLADFDQNGWDDIAVVTASSNLYVWFNAPYLGPGVAFTGPFGPIAVAIPSPTAIAAGDFGHDGFPDIVIVGNQLPPNKLGEPMGLAQVFGNQLHQTGVFVVLPAMLTWGFNARDVVTLDADGNGRDDFAVANWGSSTITVFLADAVGVLAPDTRATRAQCLDPKAMREERPSITFELFKYELQCGFFPIALAAGDFDHNGKADLAVALQSATEEPCAQNPSCIEIIYDVACGAVAPAAPVTGQTLHGSLPIDPNQPQELTSCPGCKGGGS